jgi:hypothetical protein
MGVAPPLPDALTAGPFGPNGLANTPGLVNKAGFPGIPLGPWRRWCCAWVSEAGGVITPGLLNPGEFDVGEETEEGVGRSCGDCSCTPGSSLGAMFEFDRLAWWWRFMIARCIVGGCAMF